LTTAAARTPRITAAWQRAAPVLSSSWFVGAIVAVAAWDVGMSTPTVGLDPSWVLGLYMAAHDGLHFGTQVIWTYGPLGFLAESSIAYPTLGGLALLYQSALLLALCVSLVWSLRRPLNLPIAAAVVYVTLAMLPGGQVVIVLAAIWSLAALAPDPPSYTRHVVAFGGGAFAAVECLVKLSEGPPILLMLAVALLAQPTRWRDLLRFAGTAVATFAALWFATGQGVGNLPDYFTSARQVIAGYSQAMGVDLQPHWYIFAAVEIVLMLVVWAAVAAAPGIRRAGAALVMAVAAFAAFKEGVVRFDEGHIVAFFVTATFLALAIPWRRALIPGGAVAFLVAAGVAVHVAEPPADGIVNPIPRLRGLESDVRYIVSSGRRNEEITNARAAMVSNYDLDPRTVALLRGHPVDVRPWEAAVVWAFGLDWRPEPVFQTYNAYTTALDRDNASFLASAAADQRILVTAPGALGDPPAIDGRKGSWEPPLATVTMLCRYAPLRTTTVWEVLGKVADRCGRLHALRSVNTTYGQTIAVPKAPPGAAVLAKVHGAGVSGLESLRTLFYRSDFRYATVNGATYRLVPGTAADGLLMSVPNAADFPGAFALSPDARQLALSGTSGDLRIDFYALPIRSLHRAGP
jgi:hypothetical protein